MENKVELVEMDGKKKEIEKPKVQLLLERPQVGCGFVLDVEEGGLSVQGENSAEVLAVLANLMQYSRRTNKLLDCELKGGVEK